MKIYMCQTVFSQDSQNEIELFGDKEPCMTYINKKIDEFCTQTGLTRNDVVVGLDSWHLETNDYEITFYYEEKEIK